MISYFIIVFLKRYDEELDIPLSTDNALFSAFSELTLFMLWSFYIDSDGQMIRILISLIAAIYFNLTVIIDYYIGCVYKFLNIIVLFIIILFNLRVISFTFSCSVSVFLLIVFLFLCDRIKAFGRGDSEFVFVNFWILCMGISMDNVLLMTLGILLFSSILFGIFRTVCGRKEGMIPYTPFIACSECIILTVLCLIK